MHASVRLAQHIAMQFLRRRLALPSMRQLHSSG
jgi:hypothetical protein